MKGFYMTSAIKIKVTPEDQRNNVLNYLITGWPLASRALDGVVVEFLEGENIGKQYVFQTELYEVSANSKEEQMIMPNGNKLHSE